MWPGSSRETRTFPSRVLRLEKNEIKDEIASKVMLALLLFTHL